MNEQENIPYFNRLQEIDIENIYRQYKNDRTIMTIHHEVEKILIRSIPHITFNLLIPSIIEKVPMFNFDIDDNSKRQVRYWMGILKEYIKTNYKELNIQFYD